MFDHVSTFRRRLRGTFATQMSVSRASSYNGHVNGYCSDLWYSVESLYGDEDVWQFCLIKCGVPHSIEEYCQGGLKGCFHQCPTTGVTKAVACVILSVG